MAKKYRVTLTADERAELEGLIGKGKADARKLAHARVLLQADEADGGPARTDGQIAAGLDLSTRTVERVRSGSSRTAPRRRCCPSRPSAFTPALSTGRRRPASSLWPARPRPTARSGGPCGCWPDGWSS